MIGVLQRLWRRDPEPAVRVRVVRPNPKLPRDECLNCDHASYWTGQLCEYHREGA